MTASTHQIKGGRQVPNYRQFLKSADNKASLANFISEYILQHASEQLPYGKSIILAGGFSDRKIVMGVGIDSVFPLDSLQSTQDEADTRMLLHAVSLSSVNQRIIVRCDDTDVLVLLIHYFSRGLLPKEVFMFAGHSGKERYISIHDIATELGTSVCECLPAVHALSGRDSTCLRGIGKRTAYSVFVENVEVLGDLRFIHEDDDDDMLSQHGSLHFCCMAKRPKTLNH